MDIRTIETRERDAVLDLLGQWFGDRAFFARYFDHDPEFRDDRCFVAVDEGRIVSTLQVFRKRVRMQGTVLEVGGVGNVFTADAYRERGLASQLLTRAIAAMDEQGFDLSLLFATRLPFYGRHGWRSHIRHLVYMEPGAASADGHYTTASYTGDDLAAVAEIYEAYSTTFSGTTVRDARYWEGQLRYAGNPEENFLVARDGDRVVAYARGTTLYNVSLVMEHGYRPGHENALAQLIAALHQGTTPATVPGTVAQLTIAPAVCAALERRGLTLRAMDDSFWMWRVIAPQRLAAKLAISESEVEAEDLFFRLLPPEQSVYWIADRF